MRRLALLGCLIVGVGSGLPALAATAPSVVPALVGTYAILVAPRPLDSSTVDPFQIVLSGDGNYSRTFCDAGSSATFCAYQGTGPRTEFGTWTATAKVGADGWTIGAIYLVPSGNGVAKYRYSFDPFGNVVMIKIGAPGVKVMPIPYQKF